MPMDPLSITLAVITLAKALKDTIETAEVIRDSFSEAPQNYRNAKRLAEEVHKTLHGMDEIYQKHEQTFSKTPFLQKAINDLKTEMKSVHEQCARLILPVFERKRNRLKVAFYSFWNRGKLEQLLSELKDHVDKCSQQFHVLSSFQTDALIIEIHDTIVQSTPHGSAVVHSPRRLGSTNMSYNGLGNVTNTQLFAFTQSTPMPMTWIADTIPLRDLSKVYLHREIGRVDLSFQSLLARWSQKSPTSVEIPTFATTWALEETLVPSLVVHQDAVILAIGIQSLLRQIQSNSWISSVNSMMDQLWRKLNDLGMYEDSIAIGTLMVNFWREITRRYPSANSSRHLVDALTSISLCLLEGHDQDQARLKIEEASNILWSLAAPEPVMQLESREDISQNWSLQILNNGLHFNGSPQLVLNAEWMLRVEGALGLNSLRSGMDVPSSSSWTIISSSLSVALQNQEISDDDWYTYAYSLLCFEEFQEPLKSHDLAKLALLVLNHLLVKYPDSDRVQVRLTYVLCRLSYMGLDSTDSATRTENLEFINQYLTVLRRLVLINPQRYVLDLFEAFWMQRTILLALGRSIEAENAYQDMINLKSLAAAPPHSDLQIPSETEGDYYARLAERHYRAGRFSDAIYAAQNAISQYSALEFMNPGQSRDNHFFTLRSLCLYLSGAHQYGAVLTEGEKAIKMIENTNTHGSDSEHSVYHYYAEILGTMMNALALSHLGTRALAQAEDIRTRIRILAHSGKVIYKQHLAQGLVTYAKVLQNNAQVKEALEYLQDLLSNWEEVYGLDTSNLGMVEVYFNCFQHLQAILQREGDVDKALHYSKAARTVGRTFLMKASPHTLEVVLPRLRTLDLDHISLLLDAGHYLEALERSEVMVSDIRKDSPLAEVDDTGALAAALNSRALVQLYNCLPDNAIATTTEALSLWQTAPTGDPHNEHLIHSCQYSSLLTLAHGLHDNGKVEEALNRLDEAEKVAQKWKSVNSMEELEASAEGGSEYETLLFERSKLLFTKGDYLEAVKLIRKVEVIQSEHSEGNDLSILESFANILSYSRILYCTLGCHEEGLAAAAKLAKLKESTRETFPGRARVMEVRLDRMRRRGAWKVVQDAKERLTCAHQNEF